MTATQIERPTRASHPSEVVSVVATSDLDEATVAPGSPFGVIANSRPLPTPQFAAASATPRRRGRRPALFGCATSPGTAQDQRPHLAFGSAETSTVCERIEDVGCFDVTAFDVRSSSPTPELMSPLGTDESDAEEPPNPPSTRFFGLRSATSDDNEYGAIDDDEYLDLTHADVEFVDFEFSIF